MAIAQKKDLEKIRQKKTKLAINFAMQGQWNDAINANQDILSIFPNDLDALNRLGKSFSELGDIKNAKVTFQNVLNLSPGNHIAVKNLERLKFINSKISHIPSQRHSNSNTFIEGSGKSCVVSLKKVANPTILLKLAPGETVKLEQNRNILIACDDSGNKLGEIDTKLGTRIIRLINGGNKYSASIISCGDNWINIILREAFKSPSQKSIISFPSIDKSSNNFSESRRNLSRAIAERELKEIDATYMKDWSNDDTEPGDDTFFDQIWKKSSKI
ncbi:MAG: hypothetical protein CM1200mP38_4200 [Dehalococcoidia bacterium]|nr:MAG: hypothetical protein CM1200mP38_4200 [Dehalococcoidia bacterium]